MLRYLFMPLRLTCHNNKKPRWLTQLPVLLHEMIHAYLAILTGSGDDEDESEERFDGSHRRHFQRCFHAVDTLTRELLGIAVSDDKEQKSSEGLHQKLFGAEAYVAAPRRVSRLSRFVSRRRPEREDSESGESERGDSETRSSYPDESETQSFASSSGRSSRSSSFLVLRFQTASP